MYYGKYKFIITRNIYFNIKKSRPNNPPDSYVSKSYITTENVFEFGPLLIGKDPENRTQPDMIKINSSLLRINN